MSCPSLIEAISATQSSSQRAEPSATTATKLLEPPGMPCLKLSILPLACTDVKVNAFVLLY